MMDRGGRTRAQTATDFAIASGVFLVAVTLVLGFIPGMLSPFTVNQDNTIIADRVAGQLGQDLLTKNTSSYNLHTRCTRDFFDGTATSPGPCKYADKGVTDGTLTDVLAVGDTVMVNVTIENTSSIVTSGGTKLAVGQTADVGTVTTAQRVVVLEGETLRLIVRVW
jgi:hypothetical protein